MKPGNFLEAELNALPRIPPDAGPDWRDWIAFRDLLLRAKAAAENIKKTDARPMIRICPKRDAICPYGDACPYAVNRCSCLPEPRDAVGQEPATKEAKL